MLRFTPIILRLVLSFCFAAGAVAADRKEREKIPLPKPPPQPVEQSVKVPRGESITIVLKIYGSQREPLQFLIRRPPMAGKLSKPKQHGKEAALVEYVPPANLEVKQDSFAYAVKNSAGVSASVEVAIEIVDEPPMLGFPNAVTFPPTLAGRSVAKEIEIENRGGGMAEGELSVDLPWRIEGPTDYRLGANERKTVMLIFSPENGGMKSGEIRFSSDRTRTVGLRGEALDAIMAEPASVSLMPQPGDSTRVGAFSLTNNTEDVQKVEFVPNPKLKVLSAVELAPGGTAKVTLATSAEALGAISETLEGRAGNAVVRLMVNAPAAGALLRANPAEIRVTQPGGAASLVVENAGGKPGYWKWESEAPFTPAEPSFELAPGEKKNLTVRLADVATGNVRTLLRLVGEGHTVPIAAEAVLGEPSPQPQAAPVQKPASRAGTKAADSGKFRKVSMEKVRRSLGPNQSPSQVSVEKVERERIVLSWQARPGVEYSVEQRNFSMKADTGEIIPQWKPIIAQIRVEGNRAIAELNKLQPGYLYVLRVVDAANPAGGLAPVQVVTVSDRRAPIFTKRRVILFGLFAALGLLIWQRFRGR